MMLRKVHLVMDIFFKILTLAMLLLICVWMVYDIAFKGEANTLFSHFFYVPIALAAFWWGRRSIFLALFLGISSIVPFFIAQNISVTDYAENILSNIMFVAIAWIMGSLREKGLQSEKILSNIIEGTSIPIFVLNEKHIVTHFNKACAALTGVSAKEIIGTSKQWMPFYTQERPILGDLIIDGMSEEEINNSYPEKLKKTAHVPNAFEMEDLVTLPSKGSSWLHITAAPLLNIKDEIAGAIISLQDVTERKLIESTLLEVQQRYQDLFDNSTDLIQCISPGGWFIYVNKTWKNTMGYTDIELANLNLFDVIHPDCMESCTTKFKKVFEGQVLNNVETTFITKDKRAIQLQGNVNCQFADEKPIATRAIFRDVTESKRAQAIIEEQSRRIKQEMDAAEKAQRELLPGKLLNYSGVKFSWEFSPSIYMSGDMINIFKMDQNQVRFYVLDVMGHGVSAALKAITLNSLLKPPPKSKALLPPSQVLSLINTRFCNEFQDLSMYTIVLGVLNLKTLELTYTRAGHCPPLIISSNGEIEELKQGGPAIGLAQDTSIRDYVVKLKPEDKLYIYTDGIIEAQNNKGERYTKKRLIDFVVQNKDMDINDITGSAVNDVVKFMERDKAEDDITLLGISIPPQI